jgi:hypothetical protein
MKPTDLQRGNILYSDIMSIEKLLELLNRNNNHDYLTIKLEFKTKNSPYKSDYFIEDISCVNNLKIEAINFFELKLLALKSEFHSL